MIGFASIAGGTGASASGITNHLMTNTVTQDQGVLAAYYGRGMVQQEPAVMEAARVVAAGWDQYSEALAGLMQTYIRQGGDLDQLEDYEDRIGHRLAVLTERIEDGLLNAPLAIVRPDIHPLVSAGLGIEPDGMLSKEEIDAVLAGRRSDGELIEGKRYVKHRELPPDPRTGKARDSTPIGSYDFTPTPAKSVSVAWAFAGPLEQARILNAHTEAAREAVGYIGQQIGHARIGDGGKDGAEPGHVGWLEFTHHTSRPVKMSVTDGVATFDQDLGVAGDPDLHTHFLIPNAVFCDSGRVGSLDTQRIRGFIFEADAFYHARLAEKLREAGFDVVRDARTGSARMTAIPEEVCVQFSKRTNMGEAWAKIQAARRGEDWDTLAPEQRAERIKNATQDRQQKSRGEKDDVAKVEDWKRQADELGWQRPASFLAYGPPAPERSLAVIHREAYETALAVLAPRLEQRAVLTSYDLRAAAGQGLIHAGAPTGVADIDAVTAIMRTDGVEQYGEQTALKWGLETDTRQVSITTELHEANERAFIRLARAAAMDRSASLSPRAVDAAAQASGLDFTTAHGKAQLSAIHRLGEGGRLSVAQGSAGSGKSAMLKPLRTAWDRQGRDVWGASLAWRQADDLVAAGISQDRVKAFSVLVNGVKDGSIRLTPQSVVAIDELGLLGTRQGLELLRLREQHGFSIVGLGDEKQIRSIEAGAIFALFRRALGDEAMPEIATTVRQQSEREREIVGLLRDGRPAEALAMKIADRTAELVPGNEAAVIARVAALYRERLEATGQAPAIAAPTNADAQKIGDAVRAERRKLGTLGPDVVTKRAVDENGRQYPLTLAVGDRVRLFRSTGATYETGRGGPIGRNGSVLDVVGISDTGLTLKNDKGKIGKVSWGKLIDKTTGRIQLAYGDAMTVHSAQGSTTNEHILALPHGSAALRGAGYSASTRHRQSAYLITSAVQEYAAVVQSRPKNDIRPVTEADRWANVAQNLLNAPVKDLATDMAQRVTGMRRGTVRGFHQALQPAAQRLAHGQTPSDAPEHAQRQRNARMPGVHQGVKRVVAWTHEVAERTQTMRAAFVRTVQRVHQREHGHSMRH